MNEPKSLIHHLIEAYDCYRAERRSMPHMQIPSIQPRWPRRLARHMIPNIGTLIIVLALLWAQSVGALPLRSTQPATASTATIAYQGRLADANGNPLTGTYPMIFRLYDVATGGTPLWTEQWTGSNSVRVSDGLFNVMLGSLNAIRQQDIAGHDQLWLGITVGTDDEMQPRVQLGSVPFAVQALTVPDGSITTAKIADGAVTSSKLNLWDLHVKGAATFGTPGADPIEGGEIRFAPTKDGPTWFNDNYYDNMRWFNCGNSGCVEAMFLDPTGNLRVRGELRAGGAKPAIVETSTFGQRKLYAAESPEVRFFDEGLAHLQNGIARVELDPVFLETIEGEYLVHVTPYGDASLYVAEIGRDYFVVKAREGDPNAAFAWRLGATHKGYAGVRLERVEEE